MAGNMFKLKKITARKRSLRRGHVWWGACMAGGMCVADTTRYCDTVNERAVHIKLECILVCFLLQISTFNTLAMTATFVIYVMVSIQNA